MNPLNIFRYVPLPLLRALALFVAAIMNRLPKFNFTRIIDINLRLAYPHLTTLERQSLSQQIVCNQALSSVESIKSWAMAPRWSIAQIHSVHHQEVLLRALDNPNGMLAIVPHLGTWEMMNAWLNQFGSPTIMFKPIKQKLANDFILQGRARLNAQLVPTDATGVKALFKTLKQGGFSIVLPDHVPKTSGGVTVPFFGVDTLTSTLAPKLASKTKCALVGLVCVRRGRDAKRQQQQQPSGQALDNQPTLLNPHGDFDIYCMALNDPALYDRDIRVATAALNLALQTMIAQHPSHYLWGYKRFKNMPVIKNPYDVTEAALQAFLQARHPQSKNTGP